VPAPVSGDRIAAYFYLSCFSCYSCLQGRESRCQRLAGLYAVNMAGGYAPLTVLPAGNAVPMPEEIPAAEATVIPDAVATSIHVCKTRLGVQPGEHVVVVGAGGGVGAHMVQVASLFGATVAGVDRTDDKLSLVEELGAIPVDSAGFNASLEELSGGADAVIDLVGSPLSLAWGLEHLRTGGKLCVLTTFRDVGFEVEPRSLVFREVSIVASRYASRSELVEGAELIRSGSVRPIIGATVKSEGVGEVHDALEAGLVRGRGALVWD
jgi:D-arabinose 1-dehydrogenase-like Zn-dependent alcohol dehydrogenase